MFTLFVPHALLLALSANATVPPPATAAHKGKARVPFMNSGLAILSSRPCTAFGTSVDTQNASVTTQVSNLAPWSFTNPTVVFLGNQAYSGEGDLPINNDLNLRVAFSSPATQSGSNGSAQATFPDGVVGRLTQHSLLESLPATFSGAAHSRFFVTTYQDAQVGEAPPQPTVVATSGGSLSENSTYQVAIAYTWTAGGRSLVCEPVSVTLGSGKKSFSVSVPAAVGGASGFEIFACCGTTATAELFQASPQANFTFSTASPVTVTEIASPCTGAPLGSTNAYAFDTARYGNQGLWYNAGVDGATGNGEYTVNDRSYSSGSTVTPSSGASGVSPNLIIATPTDGKYHASLGFEGDSKWFGEFDAGWGYELGGLPNRFLSGCNALVYSPTAQVSPGVGGANISVGGDRVLDLANANVSGDRWQFWKYFTTMYSNLATNDIWGGTPGISGCTYIYNNWLTIDNLLIPLGVSLSLSTIEPSVHSTDGLLTVENQSQPVSGHTVAEEGIRREWNNVLVTTTPNSASLTIMGDKPFRADSTLTPGTNSYSGGNGIATTFYASYPFKEGTEKWVNNRTTMTYASSPSGQYQYRYLNDCVIGGVHYADGITCGAPPTNGNAILGSYTRIPSPSTWSNYIGTVDIASAMECNGSGSKMASGSWGAGCSSAIYGIGGCPATLIPGRNGGWLLAAPKPVYSGTLTSVAGYNWGDSTANWSNVSGYTIEAGGVFSVIRYNNAKNSVRLASTPNFEPPVGTPYNIYLGSLSNSNDFLHPGSYMYYLETQEFAKCYNAGLWR